MKNTFDKQKLYTLLTMIPPGKVVTYGALEKMLGNKSYVTLLETPCMSIPTATNIHAARL